MEDHGAGCHPLLHGGHGHLQPAHAALAHSAWDPPLAAFDDIDGGDQQLECFPTASELREVLLRARAELEALQGAHQAELRRVESEAARLVASVAAERDELRRHCQSLLLLLHHRTSQPLPRPPLSMPDPPLPAAGGVVGGGAIIDEAATSEEEAELEMALV